MQQFFFFLFLQFPITRTLSIPIEKSTKENNYNLASCQQYLESTLLSVCPFCCFSLFLSAACSLAANICFVLVNQPRWQHSATCVCRRFTAVHRNLTIIECVTAPAGVKVQSGGVAACSNFFFFSRFNIVAANQSACGSAVPLKERWQRLYLQAGEALRIPVRAWIALLYAVALQWQRSSVRFCALRQSRKKKGIDWGGREGPPSCTSTVRLQNVLKVKTHTQKPERVFKAGVFSGLDEIWRNLLRCTVKRVWSDH